MWNRRAATNDFLMDARNSTGATSAGHQASTRRRCLDVVFSAHSI
jgi:hypothetical protein